ncbi:MAG: methyltransferase [Oscillospiraceae bacterium]|nr:methyltransferase [Oscillospiraceae bacterium]
MQYKSERLSENITICINDTHRFGTDAFLLADFAKHKRSDTFCDMGTGCGIIPLLVSKNNAPKEIVALDIQSDAVELLKKSLEISNIDNIKPICADLKSDWYKTYADHFSVVTMNPPYKADNAGLQNPNEPEKIARHEIMCDLNDICKVASKILKYGGRLCLCNRPERLADVIKAMQSNGIEPKRLRFASKNADTAPWLFLIEGKKGSKPFMKVLPQLNTMNSDGSFTKELMEIYKTKGQEF